METIYLDNNATTPLLPTVWEALHPFLTENFGNPASAHRPGRRARRALEDAREKTAALLGADPDEVIFTSGATEANNLAIFGLAAHPPAHLLTSRIEHPSVTEPFRRLEQLGFAVDHLPVNAKGLVGTEALPHFLRSETRLVSVMLVNHETGAIQPVKELAGRLEGRAVYHCDAVQAVGKIGVHFHDLGVTTLSLSAHKFHGPKGIGALLVRRHTKLPAQLWGGHQQQGRRPGTEPVALAVGLAAALDLWCRESDRRIAHTIHLRRLFLERLRESASPVILNGSDDFPHTVPHTVNLSFPGCKADALLMNLDLAGVACATGSACSSGSLLPSPVLQAMQVPQDVLQSAMRFSLSFCLSETEVLEGARRIARVVQRLRRTAAEDRSANPCKIVGS